jgi:hypothetical protein
MSTFIPLADVRREEFDWGVIGWRLVPSLGRSTLVVMDVELTPGGGHAFHRHPGQEEMIVVKEGTIVQFVGEESATLTAGDSVFIPRARCTPRSTTTPSRPPICRSSCPRRSAQTPATAWKTCRTRSPWRSLRG